MATTINRIIDLFHVQDKSGPQEFAIGFLVKSLFISKISYMIDGVKTRVVNKLGRHMRKLSILNKIETIGSAWNPFLSSEEGPAEEYFTEFLKKFHLKIPGLQETP